MARFSNLRPGSELHDALKMLENPNGHSRADLHQAVAKVNKMGGFPKLVQEAIGRSPVARFDSHGRVALIATVALPEDALGPAWLTSTVSVADKLTKQQAGLQCDDVWKGWRVGRCSNTETGALLRRLRRLEIPGSRLAEAVLWPLVGSIGLASMTHYDRGDPHASLAHADTTLQPNAARKTLATASPAFVSLAGEAAKATEYALRSVDEGAAVVSVTQAIGRYGRPVNLANPRARAGSQYRPFLQTVEISRHVLFGVHPAVAAVLCEANKQEASGAFAPLEADAVELLQAAEPEEMVPLTSVLRAQQNWREYSSAQPAVSSL